MDGPADDTPLLTRYAAGDVAAFETLYTRHKGRLYQYLLRQCGDPEVAADLYQQAWALLIKGRGDAAVPGSFATRLYRLAHQRLVDYQRRTTHDQPPGTPSEDPLAESLAGPLDPAFASARWSLVDWEQGPESEQGAAGAQRVARLRSALEALAVEQREAFLLHEEARLSLAEIALVTATDAEGISKWLRGAVQALAAAVGESPGDLKALLARESPLSAAYGSLEAIEPPETLDKRVLDGARAVVARPAAPESPPVRPLPAGPAVQASDNPAARPAPARAAPSAAAGDDDEEEDDAPRPGRPRWLVPAVLAVVVLAAIGLAVNLLGSGAESPEGANPLGSVFARRARERSDADKAAADATAAAAAAQDAEVVDLDVAPLPPPPVFPSEGPQVQNLEAAMALIRRELVVAGQRAAIQQEAGASAAAPADSGVIQPRERRLSKILELYDGGSQDLAADSLEIFLRDFEDDPICKRILDLKPAS